MPETDCGCPRFWCYERLNCRKRPQQKVVTHETRGLPRWPVGRGPAPQPEPDPPPEPEREGPPPLGGIRLSQLRERRDELTAALPETPARAQLAVRGALGAIEAAIERLETAIGRTG